MWLRTFYFMSNLLCIITSEATSSIQIKRFPTHRAVRTIIGIGFLHGLSNLRCHISPNIYLSVQFFLNENLGFGLAVHTEFVKFGHFVWTVWPFCRAAQNLTHMN